MSLYVFHRAAELMVKSGPNVTLRISKQSAIYHGLATLLSQPSPMVTRGSIIQGFLALCQIVQSPTMLTQHKREICLQFYNLVVFLVILFVFQLLA